VNNLNNFFKILPILFFCTVFAGCAGSGGSIQTSEDRFNNTIINHTADNDLPRLVGENLIVFLNAAEKITPDGSHQYFLVLRSEVLLHGQGDLPLMPDDSRNSLYVIADDARFSCAYNDQQGNRYWFPITRAQLAKIAASSDVEVRIIQPKGIYWERKLAPKNVQNFRDFAARFLN
jgi:hypothetical protein